MPFYVYWSLVFCLRQGPARVRVQQTWRKRQGLLTEAAGRAWGLHITPALEKLQGPEKVGEGQRETKTEGRDKRQGREGREERKEERAEGRKEISGDLGVFIVAEKSRKMSPKE